MSWLVIGAFVVFTSSLPFDAALLLGGEGLFSISRVLGYAFFGLSLLQPRLCFRKPPRAFWWFALYVGIYVVTGIAQPTAYWPEIASTIFRFSEFLVLFWISYNLFQEESVAKWALWGFGLSCVAVACLLVGGIGVTYYRKRAGRQTVFGQGPNTIASIIVLGAVTLIGMAYGKANVRQKVKLAAWGGFLLVAFAVTRTGSRGALVALGAGLMTLLTAQGSARTRVRNALIVILSLAACVVITISSAASASRWQDTLEHGSMAGRQRIYLEAAKMFLEKPILGWGPASNYYELGRRLSEPKRDTHNVVLWLLTEQGIVGSFVFFSGLWLVARAAWRGRRGAQGLLPLALFVAVLTVNLSGTYYVTKWFWIIMAYALASETYVRRRKQRMQLPMVARPGAARLAPSVTAPGGRNRGVARYRDGGGLPGLGGEPFAPLET